MFEKEPLSIKFERMKEFSEYQLGSEADLALLRSILKNKLNQRGFHEQFKPIKKIGKGNFASVYLAQKLEDGQSYAVKAFSKEAAYSEENGKECLIKEIEVMRCLDHNNIMKLHEVFES
jgi:serine/threonine protein kinase